MNPSDVYCARCGAKQGEADAGGTAGAKGAGSGAAPPPAGNPHFLDQVTASNASVMCYIPWVGWIMSIIVLATEKFRPDRIVRFHAFQGLYLFVVWLFVSWVFSPLTDGIDSVRFIGRVMKLGVLGVWIFMIVKTSQGEMVRLPLLGELADRSVAEQK